MRVLLMGVLMVLSLTAWSAPVAWQSMRAAQVKKQAAVLGYRDQQPLHACLAAYTVADGKVAWYPGELRSTGCLVTYAGKSFFIKKYKILRAKEKLIKWIGAASVNVWRYRQVNQSVYASGYVPPGLQLPRGLPVVPTPMVAGYERDEHQQQRVLYVCRVMFHNKIYLGKWIAPNCDVAYQGKEWYRQPAEVLAVHAGSIQPSHRPVPVIIPHSPML